MKFWMATTDNGITYAFVDQDGLMSKTEVVKRMVRGMFSNHDGLVITQLYLETKPNASKDSQMAFICYPDADRYLMSHEAVLFVASNKGHAKFIGCSRDLNGEFVSHEDIVSYYKKWAA